MAFIVDLVYKPLNLSKIIETPSIKSVEFSFIHILRSISSKYCTRHLSPALWPLGCSATLVRFEICLGARWHTLLDVSGWVIEVWLWVLYWAWASSVPLFCFLATKIRAVYFTTPFCHDVSPLELGDHECFETTSQIKPLFF